MPYDVERLVADTAQLQNLKGGFGTGRLIAKNLILTSAHVVSGSAGIIPDGWKLRLARDWADNGWRFSRDNEVVWSSMKHDLALVRTKDYGSVPYTPKFDLQVATITGNNAHRVEARGYPRAAKDADGRRGITPVLGRLLAADTRQPLQFGVDSSDLPNDPHNDWPGMSGSAVWFHNPADSFKIWIYGTIQGVPANFNGQLRVSPLSAVCENRAFQKLLRSAGASSEPQDPTQTEAYRFRELIPAEHGSYRSSMLSLIVSSTLSGMPIASLRGEPLLAGHSLLELYKTIEVFLERYQSLFDEIVEVLTAGGIQPNVHQSVYGSFGRAGSARLLTANRKLGAVASDMRQLAAELDSMLPPNSKVRQRLTNVLKICANISVAEDFLVVNLGMPNKTTDQIEGNVSSTYPSEVLQLGLEGWDQSSKLPEYARVQAELEAYRLELRAEIAKASGE